jgi:hypothetical protein
LSRCGATKNQAAAIASSQERSPLHKDVTGPTYQTELRLTEILRIFFLDDLNGITSIRFVY